MFKRLKNSFLTGMAVIVPIFVTIVVMRFFITKINGAMLAPVVNLVTPYFEQKYVLFGMRILVFFLIIFLIALIGFATRMILFNRLIGLGEIIFSRVPVANTVYSTMKQLSSIILKADRGFLKQPILVEYPRKGIYSMGFITSSDTFESISSKFTNENLMHIYVPTSPNPTSGYFLVAKKEDVIELDITTEDALKLVISGGAIIPGTRQAKLRDAK